LIINSNSSHALFISVCALLFAFSAMCAKYLASISAFELVFFRSLLQCLGFYVYYKSNENLIIEFDGKSRKIIIFSCLANLFCSVVFFVALGSNLTIFATLSIMNSSLIFNWIISFIIMRDSPTQ